MDNKLVVNKGKRNVPRNELELMPKEDLVEMIIKLEAHNKQLKNILEKKVNPKKSESTKRKKVAGRSFDFTKWNQRHVLMKFLYLGWDYEGYVVQEHTVATIEHQLFEALVKVCLIENREKSNYNRCGRTDKGVSAFEQVISIDIRSKVKPEDQFSEAGVKDEINYCLLLNKVLPKEIRAISWQPLVTQNFSARFDCIGRTYKYFFPRGNLNIGQMQEACKHLVGSHDFRNLCKMDVGNGVVNYMRRLDHVEIKLATKNHECLEPFDMWLLEIKGSAFLWHMIRCIVSILLLIGQENESPEIVRELLDIENNTMKPQYSMASEIPLNLFLCNFREDFPEDCAEVPTNIEMLNKWVFDEEALRDTVTDLQEHWCNETVKSTMIYEMMKVLREEYSTHFTDQPEINKQMSSLNRDLKRRDYQKLMDRQKCSTLEDRIEHFTKKRRIVKADDS